MLTRLVPLAIIAYVVIFWTIVVIVVISALSGGEPGPQSPQY